MNVNIPFDLGLKVEKEILPDFEEFQINCEFNVDGIKSSYFQVKTVLYYK